jgi:hypothetical protein
MKWFTLLTAAFLIPTLSFADATTPLEVGSLKFTPAAPWVTKEKPRQMSAGGFTIPGKDGAAAVEADFYFFGGPVGGGDIASNLKRWQNQFERNEDGQPPAIEKEEITLGETKATMAQLKGTFLSGPAMATDKTPMPGYAMVGVIIELADGNVFVKMVGPEAGVTAAKPEFMKLIKTAFPAK